MSWAVAKAALAEKLEDIAITTPRAITTSRVYRNPPNIIEGSVAWVLFAPRMRGERVPGGWAEKTYRYRAQLVVWDPNAEVASLMVENICEATWDAFHDQSSLRVGGVHLINGPDIDEPGTIEDKINDRLWHVADCFFDIRYGEAKTFG